MHKIDTAAAFIKHNMPLGPPDSLSDQEAWDIAAYVNSHERPLDPRDKGDLAATTEQFHGGKFDYYGKRKGADGKLLGESSASSPTRSATASRPTCGPSPGETRSCRASSTASTSTPPPTAGRNRRKLKCWANNSSDREHPSGRTLKDPLKREFYAEMCRVERWSTRTLAKKIDSMLYGCSARSRIPSAADPERRDLDIKPMMGRDGYRLRIGRWRALYRIENDRMVILVVEIVSRGDLYK